MERRDFLKAISITVVGLAVGLPTGGPLRVRETFKYAPASFRHDNPFGNRRAFSLRWRFLDTDLDLIAQAEASSIAIAVDPQPMEFVREQMRQSLRAEVERRHISPARLTFVEEKQP